MQLLLNSASATLAAAIMASLSVAPNDARAKNYGDKFARCLVDESRKPGYVKETAWPLCEKRAQVERDAELNSAPNQGPNLKLLKPALAFHWCVEKQTQASLAPAKRVRFKSASEAEGAIWNEVLDKCFSVLATEENEAMVYQNYAGNASQMLAYRDGLLWAGRAYVFSAVADIYQAKK